MDAAQETWLHGCRERSLVLYRTRTAGRTGKVNSDQLSLKACIVHATNAERPCAVRSSRFLSVCCALRPSAKVSVYDVVHLPFFLCMASSFHHHVEGVAETQPVICGLLYHFSRLTPTPSSNVQTSPPRGTSYEAQGRRNQTNRPDGRSAFIRCGVAGHPGSSITTVHSDKRFSTCTLHPVFHMRCADVARTYGLSSECLATKLFPSFLPHASTSKSHG